MRPGCMRRLSVGEDSLTGGLTRPAPSELSEVVDFPDSMTEGLAELRDSLSGDVLTASDREYERGRLCFNLLIDRRPAARARCVDADDVAVTLAFGQAHGLEISVRGGGHN